MMMIWSIAPKDVQRKDSYYFPSDPQHEEDEVQLSKEEEEESTQHRHSQVVFHTMEETSVNSGREKESISLIPNWIQFLRGMIFHPIWEKNW